VGLLIPVVHERERTGGFLVSAQRADPYFTDILALWRARFPRQRLPPTQVADGCTAETLRKWVRQGERDNGIRPGATTAEQQRIKELVREVRELRKTNEILKLASAYFAQAELDRQHKK
jgi:hypothetical protein